MVTCVRKTCVFFEDLESEILSRIGNHECEEENRETECRNEGSPGSFERGDEPRSGLWSCPEIHGSSHGALGCAVGGVYQPPWGRLRMNLYGGRQRAFANFLNELSALKEEESQRLVVAYGAGRWVPKKGTTPAPTTRMYKECARRFVTIPVDEFRT